MFTGLVEAVGELARREPGRAGFRLGIASPLARELTAGESLAVNGVCLTVAAINGDRIHADVGPETLRVTTLGDIPQGARVNLERPLRADGRFGGHFVQGHADAVGQIEQLRPEADYCWLTVSFPKELAPFIVRKGSIAVDGISLTVARLAADSFDVQLVPYTMQNTNLVAAQAGDRVNIECDVIGKYVVRACQTAEVNVRA
jgi:riboflavin synthase